MSPQNLALGALLLMAAELMFTAMGATIKQVSQGLPSEVVVFFRNALALTFVLPWMLRQGFADLKPVRLRYHLLRSLAGVGAMYCFFFALAHLPLAEATILKMTAPLFIPLIALVWLGEGMPVNARWGIGLGFVGVLLILKPGLAALSPVALVGLAGGALAALAKVTIRRMSAATPGIQIVFYFSLIATLVSAVPLTWAWQTPTLPQWGLILGVGVLGTLGQLLMTRAYAQAPAGQVGAFGYVSVLYAAVMGWVFWGETVDGLTVLGAGLIVLAGLAIMQGRKTAAAVRPPPAEAVRKPA